MTFCISIYSLKDDFQSVLRTRELVCLSNVSSGVSTVSNVSIVGDISIARSVSSVTNSSVSS